MSELEMRQMMGELKGTLAGMVTRFDRHEISVRDTQLKSDRMNTILFEKIEKLQNTLSEARGGFKMASIFAHVITFFAALAVGHYWK